MGNETKNGTGTAVQVQAAAPAQLPAKIGRPCRFNPKTADLVLGRLMHGESLKAICRDPGMPPASTVRQWAIDDVSGFAAQFEHARIQGLWSVADDMLEISDDGRNDWMRVHGKKDAGWIANGENVQRSRLRIESRRWLLSKLLPKHFGDKIEQQITGAGGAPLTSPTFNLAFVTPPSAAANDAG